MPRMVIIALDFPSADSALNFTDKLDTTTCALKVGFELFISAGPVLVEKLVERGFKVFLDLKLHDIPNTVAQGCASAARLGVWMVNVHASGGMPMMLAARESIDKFKKHQQPLLIAVTVLTSMNQSTLASIGIQANLDNVVSQWTTMARKAQLDGVVSSAREAAQIRAQSDEEFLIVTPGIRMQDGEHDDQHRVVTPNDAYKLGVSHIVVGRPITQAKEPNLALEAFQKAFTSA